MTEKELQDRITKLKTKIRGLTHSLNGHPYYLKLYRYASQSQIDEIEIQVRELKQQKRNLVIDLPGEKWIPVKELPRYQISNFGRVKGVDGKLMKIGVSGIGNNQYPSVRIIYDNGKTGTRFIHRMVAIAFIPNPLNIPQVNHIDYNKFNFAIENLEWCTQEENMKHAVDNRLMPHGENQKSAKLTNDQVRELRKMKKDNPKITYQKLAEKYGIDNSNAYRAVMGINYRHVE